MIDKNKLENQKVLLRADLDISSPSPTSYRLQTLLPSLKLSLTSASQTLLIGHYARPTSPDPKYSLESLVPLLEQLLGVKPAFLPDTASISSFLASDQPFALLENLRFFPGEESQDLEFARSLTSGFNIYLYDAFANYHPSASLSLIPTLLPTSTGLHFDAEVEALKKVLHHPQKPTLLILSGAKPDKLKLLPDLASKFDTVLLGGAIAHQAASLSLKNVFPATLQPSGLDIDSSSIELFEAAIKKSQTIVLNGPVGKFEDPASSHGTKEILSSLASSSAFTLLGGGDTLSAIDQLGFSPNDFSFVSTGGGAMLEFLRSGTHPLLKIIQK